MHLGVNLRTAQVKAMNCCNFSSKLSVIMEEDESCILDDQEIDDTCNKLDDTVDKVQDNKHEIENEEQNLSDLAGEAC